GWEADAHNFAGCLLMPREAVEAEFARAVALARARGVTGTGSASFGAYAAQPLSKAFGVSAKTAEIRLSRLGLSA
ncbi:MAG TPA: hypothetical protein VIE13_08345, partial [Terriglobales bacterium]